jgi:UDP-glucose 4-epimerase
VLVASSRRARRELGWQPRHSNLDEMLTDAWAWRMAHPRGYPKAGTRAARRHAGQNGELRKAEPRAQSALGEGLPATTTPGRARQPSAG